MRALKKLLFRLSFRFIVRFSYYSDFRYESNGIFVLVVGFFIQTNSDFLTSHC